VTLKSSIEFEPTVISRNRACKSSNQGGTRGFNSNTIFLDEREARAQNVLFQSISAVSTAKASLLRKNGIY
tara:strand:- start:41 stop:253 length:213 start_codon:yes stop_codon:yes gene_type:complete